MCSARTIFKAIKIIRDIKLLPVAQFRICVLSAVLAISSCAVKQMPTGGAKDVTPPKVIKSTPANYSTSFTGKEIKIDFDEYIDLKDLSKQLVISPLMPSEPDVRVKNKSLLITLPDSLKRNTTYTLNFGNAIVDTHESNALDDFQYVFATGPVLDSLQLSGEIKFAENLKSEKGILAMLYTNTSDTIVYNSLPDYFAKTDSSGNFLIKNLHPGTYKLFALKDANNNYKFDSKTESIGFSDELVTIPDTGEHHLRLFTEPDTIPHVLKAQFVSPGKAILVFTSPLTNFELKVANESVLKQNNLLIEKSQHMDTVFVYSLDTLADSLHAFIYNKQQVIDTVHVNLKPRTQKGRGELIGATIQLTTNFTGNFVEAGTQPEFIFSAPLKSFDSTKVILTKDSITPVNFTIIQVDSLKKNFRINFKTEENKSYKLFIPPKVITDIFYHQNDSITLTFKTREEREYASIVLNFTGAESNFNYIIQLLTDDDKLVQQLPLNSNQKITFRHVLPGKYKIRIIDDANKNGKWDSGFYARHIQPEKVFYYPESISTRSNWDVDLKWDLK